MDEVEYTEEELEAAVTKKLEENDGYMSGFDGMNCNDYEDNQCSGWNGKSRRCDCGNRRVSWEAYRSEDGTIEVYAVAY